MLRVLLVSSQLGLASFISTNKLALWVSYQIRQNAGRECRDRIPRHQLQRKPQVSDPGMHQGTCVTHVLWCMSGSLTNGGGENVPGISGARATRNFAYLVRGPWPWWVIISIAFRGMWLLVHTLTLTHWGLRKIAAISQTIFSNAFSWTKMYEFRLRFHGRLFPRFRLRVFQHWFIWWLGVD